MQTEEITSSWTLRAVVALTALTLYPLCLSFYHVFFDKLSHVPGPRLWAASRLPYIRYLLKGTIVQEVEKLHRKYGPVVRIAPNEVSLAGPQAMDVLTTRPNHEQFIKDPLWWGQQPGRAESLLSTPSLATHARMRKTLSYGFTESALKAQEPILQKHVALLVSRLHDQLDAPGSGGTIGTLDIVPWFNFVAFDIFGDLAFGQSFDCLQTSRLHPWIELLFHSVKAACYVISARFYPLIEFSLMKCIPDSIMEKQRNQFKHISRKVQSRFNWEASRPDLMEHVIKHNDEVTGMSIPEIESTFAFLANAGSETTATTLSGTLNHLVAYPKTLELLTDEVRKAFRSESDIMLEGLARLPYLNAVINEGLRLSPPVPTILPRLVPKGGDTACGVWLPEKTSVSISLWTINHDLNNFHEASNFRPERWMHGANMHGSLSSPFQNDSLEAVKTFSVGPRSCMGRRLAWAEMRLVLASMVWSFDISSGVEPDKILHWDQLKCFLLWEKEPVLLKLQPRRTIT